MADRIVAMVDGTIKSDVFLTDAMRVCEFLRSVHLFQHLTPSEITQIAGKMERRRFASGEPIIKQGEEGNEFFIIGEGAVDVIRDEEHVATLGVGDFFGERALLTDEPRNATVVSKSDVETYRLGKLDFRNALEASPSFKEQVYSIYFQRN